MYSKKQRIAAIAGIVILVLFAVATLIAAIFNFDGQGVIFRLLLFITLLLPIVIWLFIWMFGKMTGKKTIASLFNEVEVLEEAEEALRQNTSSDNADKTNRTI